MPKCSCLSYELVEGACNAKVGELIYAYSLHSRASNGKDVLHIRCTDVQILTFLMAHRQYSQQTKCIKCHGQVKYQRSR